MCVETWAVDEDKLTFIVLARDPSRSDDGELPGPWTSFDSSGLMSIPPVDEGIAALPMIGDVNIFLKGTVPPSVNDSRQSPSEASKNEDQDHEGDEFEAEVEIMIAGTFSFF